MASGRQLAKENLKKFETWVEERQAANDWTSYLRGNQLNRTEIARECAFAASVLRQNPAVKSALDSLESDLRQQGLIQHEIQDPAERSAQRRALQASGRDKERIKSLEEQNAALKAEVDALKQTLKRYELFDQHLAQTGRIIKP